MDVAIDAPELRWGQAGNILSSSLASHFCNLRAHCTQIRAFGRCSPL